MRCFMQREIQSLLRLRQIVHQLARRRERGVIERNFDLHIGPQEMQISPHRLPAQANA